MNEFMSRFDKAIDSIEKFLEMEISPSIVLSLYRSEQSRLLKRYPNLTFMPIEAVSEQRKLYKYIIQKK